MFFKETEKDQKCCKCDAVTILSRLIKRESDDRNIDNFHGNH